MSPIEEVISNFQELIAWVPDIVQPFIVMIAATIPFVEGEAGAVIGIVGGLHPIVAAVAAATGNFLSVLLVVALTSRTRTAVVDRRSSLVRAGAGGGGYTSASGEAFSEPAFAKPESKRRQRFNRWLVRFGVPGASILGPLAIPTQITSAILVGGGTPRRWVLLWQAVAIIFWTTVTTASVWAALTFVVGVA